jgi:hypothetical protein
LINNDNITSHGVSSKKVEYYMTVLRNSKELTDSLIGDESFKITNMHFRRVKPLSREVDFYGNIESENESRYISGRLYDLWNKIYIKNATVMRIGVPLEETGIFTFGEGFCRLDTNEVLRITRYDDVTYVFSKIDINDFYNPVIEEKRVLVRG